MQRSDAERLARWKYAVDDPSISTQLLTPFWNACAKRVPRAIAPNILTAISGLLNVLSGLVALVADGESARGPSRLGCACVLSSALLAWLGATFDCIDGKHARNTGQASPLGEYWDHMLDATTGALFAVSTAPLAIGLHGPKAAWLCAAAFAVGFLEPHAEALCTGVLVFPRWTGVGEVALLIYALLGARAAAGNAPLLPLLVPTGWELPLVVAAVLTPASLVLLRTLARGCVGREPQLEELLSKLLRRSRSCRPRRCRTPAPSAKAGPRA